MKEIGDVNERIAKKEAHIQKHWRIAFKYVLTGISLLYMIYFTVYLIMLRLETSSEENILVNAIAHDYCITIESVDNYGKSKYWTSENTTAFKNGRDLTLY